MGVTKNGNRINVSNVSLPEALQYGKSVKQLGPEFACLPPDTEDDPSSTLVYYRWKGKSGVYEFTMHVGLQCNPPHTRASVAVSIERSDPTTRPGYKAGNVPYISYDRRKKLRKGKYFSLWDEFDHLQFERYREPGKFVGKFSDLFSEAFSKICSALEEVYVPPEEEMHTMRDFDASLNRVIDDDKRLLEGRKIKEPSELENERIIQKAEEDFEVDFKWYIDTDVDPREEGDFEGEYYYCVATLPNGSSEALAGIEDPDPSYKKQVEADLARALGIKPDFLPPEVEDMHRMRGYDESLLESPEEDVLLEKINDALTPLGFSHWKNNWFKDLEFPVKGRSYPGRVRLSFEFFRNPNELVVELSGLSKRGGLSFDLKTKEIWLDKIPFDINRLDDFSYFSKLAGTAGQSMYVSEVKKLLRSLFSYYKATYKEVASLYEIAMGKILSVLNPTPEIEDMHTLRGYDETLIRKFEEVVNPPAHSERNTLLIMPEVYDDALKWAQSNQIQYRSGDTPADDPKLGYQFKLEDYAFALSFPNPKYPGQKGFVVRFFYFPKDDGTPNIVSYRITYGKLQLHLQERVFSGATLKRILNDHLVHFELTRVKYDRVLALPEFPLVAAATDGVLRKLEYVPDVEDMHKMRGYDESRLSEGMTASEFNDLKIGSIFYYTSPRDGTEGQWKVTKLSSVGKGSFATRRIHAKLIQGNTEEYWSGKIYFFDHDRANMSLGPVEPEDMHKMRGYDETRLFEETTPVPRAIWTRLCSDLENRYPDYFETASFSDPVIKMMGRETGSVLMVEAYPTDRKNPNSPLQIYRIIFDRLPTLPGRPYVYHYTRILGTGITEMPVSLPDFINSASDVLGVEGAAKRKKIAFADLKKSPEIVTVYEEIARTINRAGIPDVEDMHTLRGYDETRLTENSLQPVTREEWAVLKPGTVIISYYRGGETGRFNILSQHTLGSKALPIIRYFASSLAGDWKGLLNYEEGKWYWEKPPEIENMHVMRDYDETLIRRVTVALVDDNPANY